MSSEEGRDELKQTRVDAMGAELGTRYHALGTELVWLNAKWQEFEALYAHSAARIDLLNEAAAYFFGQLQSTMWDDILLHLARLTDRSKSFGKDNLTIQGLDELITDSALAREVSVLIEEAISSCDFARPWRNRWLAHRDLDLALEQSATPLPPANRKNVRDALSAIGRVLQRIHAAYFDSEVTFSPILGAGDANALVSCLQHGVELQAQHLEHGSPGGAQ
jgi:AbiU2